MVICRSYMFEFSVSKDMTMINNNDKREGGGGNMEGGGTFMSNTNCQGIENQC